MLINFRRLIPWMRSLMNVYETLGVWPSRKRSSPISKEKVVDLSLNWGIEFNEEFKVPLAILPDTYIKYFTDNGNLKIKDFIRCEFLEKDLISKLITPYFNLDVFNQKN